MPKKKTVEKMAMDVKRWLLGSKTSNGDFAAACGLSESTLSMTLGTDKQRARLQLMVDYIEGAK